MVPRRARLGVGPRTRVPSSPAEGINARAGDLLTGPGDGIGSDNERDASMVFSEDIERILDAMVYVEAVHKSLVAENTAPPPGIEGRVVSAILADADLSTYVQRWARERHALEASLAPPAPPPIDDAYRRVCAMLTAEEKIGG
jgi:hypothetical protein